MINTLARIDQLASSGTTAWHRASAISKLLLATTIITLAIASRSIALLGSLYAFAWLLVITSRLPARLVVAAASYPLLFSALFVLGSWDQTWQTPVRLLLRPLTASLTAVWLVGTTPYPDLFAPISRVLPRSVGDGLFLTYRGLFELMASAERLWRALRLRGGTQGSPRRRLNLAGESLGSLVLFGFERSQRQYAAMLLRGHSGRICGCRHWAEWTREDAWVALAGAGVAAASLLLWRKA
ncbi:MAG TPA: CbiQ family ECF transporter T component [Candidatus Udaeobacter sp.]|nr:CbiQ family ECF transporter T component [Candidatus Udaeobacter sp.]